VKYARLTDEQQQLVAENINFVFMMARKHVARNRCLRNYENEVISLACNAACKAATLYDPGYRTSDGRSVKFATLAKYWIHSEIKTYVNKVRRSPGLIVHVPYHAKEKFSRQRNAVRGMESLDGSHQIEDYRGSIEIRTDGPQVWGEVGRLPFRTQNVLIDYFIKGQTLRQIGDSLTPPLTRERARQIRNEGLNELRKMLGVTK